MSDLYPPCFPSPSAAIRYAPNSLGRMFSEQPANYYLNPNCKRVLFSFDPSLGDLVRSALYALSAEHFEEDSLADGGDLNGLPLDETIRLLHDLVELQQKSILLVGAEPELLRALQEQWTKGYQPHRISVITDSAQIVSHFDTESIYLKDLHVIGYQRQFPSPAGQMLSYIRTGSFRTSHSVIEPAIRTSDLCYFDLNAVRSSDSPGNLQKNPSGFFAEEASTISRICGMGDRMKMFAISTWNENQDPDKITSQLVAQIIWYFWEGSHLKELDQQLNRENLTQYLVDLKDLDYVIKFYKSENTGKWWFEEPLVDNAFSNQLMPCTYDEYLATAKDQIPERIMELING